MISFRPPLPSLGLHVLGRGPQQRRPPEMRTLYTDQLPGLQRLQQGYTDDYQLEQDPRYSWMDGGQERLSSSAHKRA